MIFFSFFFCSPTGWHTLGRFFAIEAASPTVSSDFRVNCGVVVCLLRKLRQKDLLSPQVEDPV